MLIWTRMEKWRLSKISQVGRVCRVHIVLFCYRRRFHPGPTWFSKVFVTYFDVSKAFDSVWINSLFYQLSTGASKSVSATKSADTAGHAGTANSVCASKSDGTA